ncbi:hypothetical protein C8R42DRAFT_715050 [Lentinula raphanica]|nr:hypothetical protein C8R42DRAFT_715050 [Lentinula raphanica]
MTRFVHRLGSFLILGGISFGALAAPTSTSPSTDVQVLKSSDPWSSSGGLPAVVNVLKARGAMVSSVRDNVKLLHIGLKMVDLALDIRVLKKSEAEVERQELLTGLEHPNELAPEQWQQIANRWRTILDKTESLSERLDQKPKYRQLRDLIRSCLQEADEEAQFAAADRADRAALASSQALNHGSASGYGSDVFGHGSDSDSDQTLVNSHNGRRS